MDPFITFPTLISDDSLSQGSGCILLRLNAIRKFSISMLIICTSSSVPISTKFSGSITVSQESSEICINPSAPSISTNTPNLEVPSTLPFTISLTLKSFILTAFNFFLIASSAARSEKIARFLRLLSSVILNSIGMPIKPGLGGPDG